MMVLPGLPESSELSPVPGSDGADGLSPEPVPVEVPVPELEPPEAALPLPAKTTFSYTKGTVPFV